LLLLIPALAVAGGSGFVLAKGHRAGLIGAKAKPMPLIAANGILVLIPAALFLASKARAGEFDAMFYVVQALELAAGAVNWSPKPADESAPRNPRSLPVTEGSLELPHGSVMTPSDRPT
jgi:hypothetical protein